MAKRHNWKFKSHFRANAYGWKGTRLASKRLQEAVSEIKKAARSDQLLAADGAVALMERLWPALEQIDSSSGALGNAVRRTLEALIPVVIAAPADVQTSSRWMERLYEAICEDGVEYLMPVEEHWGAICGSRELATQWADRMLPVVREAWGSRGPDTWVVGATLCLSCLLETQRFKELQELLSLPTHRFWHFDKFGAEALVRQGRIDEAIALAEACRGDSYDEASILSFCEQVLLEADKRDEAYHRYALSATSGSTGLAIFKSLARKYPERDPRQILLDLARRSGDKGRWFAAAKSTGCLDLALEFANQVTAEPATLIRAARDFAISEPAFASQVALCAIRSLLAGGGYEPTTLDILSAHSHLMNAAAKMGQADWAQNAVEELMSRGASPGRDDMLAALMQAVRAGKSR